VIRINEIEFELEFTNQANFKTISYEVSIFTQYTLPSLIDKHLGPIDWKEFKLEFDQIYIDLGKIRLSNIQYDLRSAIENELQRIAYKHKRDIVVKYDKVFIEIERSLKQINYILGSPPTISLTSKDFIAISRIIHSTKLAIKLERFTRIAKQVEKEPTLRTQSFVNFTSKIVRLRKALEKKSVRQMKVDRPKASELITLIGELDEKIELFVKKEKVTETIFIQPKTDKRDVVMTPSLPKEAILSSYARSSPKKLNTKADPGLKISLDTGEEVSISNRKIAGYELIDYFFKRGMFPPISIIPEDDFQNFLLQSLLSLSPAEKMHLMDNNDEEEVFKRLQKQLNEDIFRDKVLNKIIEFTPVVINNNLKPKHSYLPLLDYLNALLFDDQSQDWIKQYSAYSIHDVVNILFHRNPALLQNYFIEVLTKGNKAEIEEKVSRLFDKGRKASITKMIYTLFSKSQKAIKVLNAVNKILKDQGIESRKGLTAQLDFVNWLVDKNYLRDNYELKLENIFGYFQDKYKINPNKTITEILKKDPYKSKNLVKRKFKFTLQEKIEVTDSLLYFLQYGSIPYKEKLNIEDLSQLIDGLKDHNLLDNITGYQILNNQNLRLLGTGQILKLLKKSTFKGKNELIDLYNKHSKEKDDDLAQYLLFYTTLKKPVNEDDFTAEFDNFNLKKKRKQIKYVLRNDVGEIHVKNAGLVLLWPHLKRYFSFLGMLDEKDHFINDEMHERAVLLLQYLATKQSYAEEHYLALNKIMVGYPLEEPVINEIVLTEKESDITLAMLRSIIKSWPSFENSSTDSLRGGFLVRNGILTQSASNWNLSVEKKAYDLLLDRLPWGFGKIKLPWNPYMIEVEWK
jgi:hypothetical protein